MHTQFLPSKWHPTHSSSGASEAVEAAAPKRAKSTAQEEGAASEWGAVKKGTGAVAGE